MLDREGYPISMNEIVWHYCSKETFVKIIEEGYFMLGDLRNMTDSSEFSAFFDEISSIVKKTNQVENAGKIVGALYGSGHRFSASFSYSNDMFPMWKIYGDDGEGFAIGFDKQKLESLKSDEVKIISGDINYFNEENKKIIQEALSNIKAGYEYVQIASELENRKIKWQLYKSPQFEYEKEWRLYVDIDDFLSQKCVENCISCCSKLEHVPSDCATFDIDFESCIAKITLSSNSVVFKLKLLNDEESLVTNVIIGPLNKCKKSQIDAFLKKNNFYGVEVMASNCPLVEKIK